MRKVLLFSMLLLLGLLGSQWLPSIAGSMYATAGDVVRIITMTALSFIMIRVGYEFDIDKANLKQYGRDYLVAFTAASFPWLFVTFYFVFVLLPPEVWGSFAAWKETLLAGRFAAPTSAGILFSMLLAAGLGRTWLFRKARILAIFDDLDTVLLMIPLKMIMVGFVWQLGITVVVMAVMLTTAFIFLHKIRIPVTWHWVLAYSAVITAISEMVYKGSMFIDESVPIHIEVLLPAFVLGCVMAYPKQPIKDKGTTLHEFVNEDHGHEAIDTPGERKVTTVVTSVFMILVGLSMPLIFSGETAVPEGTMSKTFESTLHAGGSPAAEAAESRVGSSQKIGRITATQPPLTWGFIFLHVLIITVISNLGKMIPALCYRKEAHWRERLALAIGMWPRGEVGAGVLIISLSYGIGGPIITIAMLSLALNLLLTGLFIYVIMQLIAHKTDFHQPGTGSTSSITSIDSTS
jgi:Kef-type K+ transport system membrane component KefB